MNKVSSLVRSGAAICALLLFCGPATSAPEPAAPASARDLASSLAAAQEGAAYVRLRMEVKETGQTYQIQIKERRSRASAEVLYQVLFPKEEKGAAVLLRAGGGRASSGVLFSPPDKTQTIAPGQMGDAFLGGDLCYQDLVDNFFTWEHQAIVGEETVDGVPCQILESKPGGDRSVYSSVRTWVDPKRMVAMRIAKFSGGKLVRQIDTTRVAKDDRGRPIPANLSVRGPRGTTELDGSRIRHDVAVSDRDFTPEGMRQLDVPKSAE